MFYRQYIKNIFLGSVSKIPNVNRFFKAFFKWQLLYQNDQGSTISHHRLRFLHDTEVGYSTSCVLFDKSVSLPSSLPFLRL